MSDTENIVATFYNRQKIDIGSVVAIKKPDGKLLIPHVPTGAFYMKVGDDQMRELPQKDWREVTYG